MAEEPRFIVMPSPESHLSWLRTRMSAECTLMSWVRTAISLIGFGFTIFQFLERLNTMPGAQPAEHPNAPRIFGLALIGSGTIALIIALWEYRWASVISGATNTDPSQASETVGIRRSSLCVAF
jgi:inner membrane protein YidH